MSWFDDLGDSSTNLLTGVGDAVSGKNKAAIAQQQLQNQRDAIAVLASLNQNTTNTTSNTGLNIGLLIAGAAFVGILVFFIVKTPKTV